MMERPVPEPGFDVGFNTPWEPQIAFLRNKLRLPSERWDDIQRSAHDRAFMVAGAVQADLLADLHQAVTQSIAEGTGLEAFRRDFKEIVARRGWTGFTGSDSQAGLAWRTRVIYQTNLSTSYAAGRYKQLTEPGFAKLNPYWRYLHNDSVLHPRPQHVAWHGLTLPREHAFWAAHFPPNGWGCQCRVTAVSRREGEASARAGVGEPPEGWNTRDGKTGAPVGIDRGFDYTPGASVDTSLRQLVQDKLITYPPAIATALSRDVTRYLNATDAPAAFVAKALADKQLVETLWMGFVEDPKRLSQVLGQDVTGYLVTLPAEAARHVEASHGMDGGTQRAPAPEDFNRLMEVLNGADSIKPGNATSSTGDPRVVVTKAIGAEEFRAVFELRPGKKNRALALLSFVVKVTQ